MTTDKTKPGNKVAPFNLPPKEGYCHGRKWNEGWGLQQCIRLACPGKDLCGTCDGIPNKSMGGPGRGKQKNPNAPVGPCPTCSKINGEPTIHTHYWEHMGLYCKRNSDGDLVMLPQTEYGAWDKPWQTYSIETEQQLKTEVKDSNPAQDLDNFSTDIVLGAWQLLQDGDAASPEDTQQQECLQLLEAIEIMDPEWCDSYITQRKATLVKDSDQDSDKEESHKDENNQLEDTESPQEKSIRLFGETLDGDSDDNDNDNDNENDNDNDNDILSINQLTEDIPPSDNKITEEEVMQEEESQEEEHHNDDNSSDSEHSSDEDEDEDDSDSDDEDTSGDWCKRLVRRKEGNKLVVYGIAKSDGKVYSLINGLDQGEEVKDYILS